MAKFNAKQPADQLYKLVELYSTSYGVAQDKAVSMIAKHLKIVERQFNECAEAEVAQAIRNGKFDLGALCNDDDEDKEVGLAGVGLAAVSRLQETGEVYDIQDAGCDACGEEAIAIAIAKDHSEWAFVCEAHDETTDERLE